MHAVVCGAGIGGLAVARGLHADGWDVTVLERDEHPAAGGAAVTLFANGFAALARLGIEGVAGLGGALDAMEFRGADGSLISRLDLGVIARRTGHGTRAVPRRDLVTALGADLPAGTVRYGCPAVEVSPDGCRVTAADGATLRPDLVVGADGHRSVVRAATLDPTPARDVGWCTWQGLDPVLPDLAGGTTGVCVVGDAGLVGLLPAGDGRLQWWCDVRTGDGHRLVDALAAVGAYAEPVGALARAVVEGERFTHRVHAIPDRWGAGPSTLVGDAAHVFPPSQAQGANQALEDAAVLVRCLHEDADVTAALRRYEAARAPRVRRISALAASEVTNRPPGRALRLAARLTPSSVAAHAWLASVRRSSNVLAGPFAPAHPT